MILPISQSATFYNLFEKLNEVISTVNSLDSSVGNLNELTTLNTSSLVGAINEKGVSLAMSLVLED